MQAPGAERSYLRELLKSRSGVFGLVLLVILVATSVYVVVGIPKSQIYKWENPEAWIANPSAVPPSWVNYLGVDAPQTVALDISGWSVATSAGGTAFTSTTTFSWDHGVTPTDLAVVPNFNGTVYEVIVQWMKPDGDTIQLAVSGPVSGMSYDLTTSSFKQGVIQFVQSQTGSFLSSVTQAQETQALFNKDGPGLLNGTVEQGTYSVSVQILGEAGSSAQASTVSVVGDSYGSMGTDIAGRPIDLGVLEGLPWALEIGAVGSAVSVVGGILWGGLAGYFGGWRDKLMSWGTLVILALPGLALLVAISYSVTLSSLSEALIIAALSWPSFAIIARSVSLSIRSQTYVEADRAMGVSGVRTFVTHFLPRLTPVTIAFTALSVSGFIITGETLSFLGIQPPNVISWGGILNDAISYDASVHGWWWWLLFPGISIFVASLPFVLVGFALDRIVAPRVSKR